MCMCMCVYSVCISACLLCALVYAGLHAFESQRSTSGGLLLFVLFWELSSQEPRAHWFALSVGHSAVGIDLSIPLLLGFQMCVPRFLKIFQLILDTVTHIQFWSNLIPPPFPQTHTRISFLPLNCVFHLLNLLSLLAPPVYAWVYIGPSTGTWTTYNDHTLASFSAATKYQHLLSCGWGFGSPSILLEFWLIESYTGLMHATTYHNEFMCAMVLPILEITVPSSPPKPLTLKIFYVCLSDLNLGLHAYTAGTLPRQCFPRPWLLSCLHFLISKTGIKSLPNMEINV